MSKPTNLTRMGSRGNKLPKRLLRVGNSLANINTDLSNDTVSQGADGRIGIQDYPDRENSLGSNAEEAAMLKMMEDQNSLLELSMRARGSMTGSMGTPTTTVSGPYDIRSLFKFEFNKYLSGDSEAVPQIPNIVGPSFKADKQEHVVVVKDLLTVWGELIAQWDGSKECLQRAKDLIGDGVPDGLRGMVWPLLAGSDSSLDRDRYAALLDLASPHEKQIIKDIARTFPDHSFFNDNEGVGRKTLFRVLRAFSLHDPHMGYCQGMAFIGGLFLMKMPEEDAFALLISLMSKYKLGDLFMPGMSLVALANFQFKALLAAFLPEVSICLEREGVEVSSYLTQWLMTLFSVALPLPIVFHIIDLLLAVGHETTTGGLEVLYRVALSVLKENEDNIVSRTMDSIMTFLGHDLRKQYESIDDVKQGETPAGQSKYDATAASRALVQQAMKLSISPKSLTQLERAFMAEKEVEDAKQARISELLAIRNGIDIGIKETEREVAEIQKMIETEYEQARVEMEKMAKRCEKYDIELATMRK
eukprot:Ihof_evm14s78 gene=Ihof_evmTU14s78